MAYQVLARKYRPQRFGDVVGQEHVTRTLGNALEQGRIAHGYIFSGHRGIGKTTIARILAMALNCRRAVGSPERPSPEPCGVCESCEEVRSGSAVDVIEIDAATNRGIDEIRELRDAARYRPARDRYKIYILDEAHQITDAAFNALLKTLEEPPEHVVFMMATTEPENIPQTIRSRCQHFSFHAVRFDAILEQLRGIAGHEGISTENEALALLAEAGDGSMRDALSIMDQAIASAPLVDGRPALDAAQIRDLMGTVPNAVFARLLEAVSENNAATVLGEIDTLLNAGNSPSQLARQFVRYLRNVLMARIAGENSELLQLSPDERARAASSALLFGEDELTRFLQIMLRTFDELNYRQEPRFHFELGLLKLVHLQRLLPVEELLSQLGGAPVARGSSPLPRPSGAAPASARVSAPPPRAAAPRPAPVSSPRPVPPPASAQPTAPSFSPFEQTPPKPSFSPFERDAQRKAGGDGTPRASVDVSVPQAASGPKLDDLASVARPTVSQPVPTTTTAEALKSEVRESAVAVLDPPAPAEEIAAAIPEEAEDVAAPLEEDEIPESVADVEPEDEQEPAGLDEIPEPTAETAVAPEPLTVSENPAAAETSSESAKNERLDRMRDAASAALAEKNHNTAAALMGSADWRETPEGIRVEVAAKKVMLGLTINTEADKLIRTAIRPFLAPGEQVNWVPSEAGAAGARLAARPVASGSIDAQALQHPLVQQAQKLFTAEVRTIVDLRPKR